MLNFKKMRISSKLLIALVAVAFIASGVTTAALAGGSHSAVLTPPTTDSKPEYTPDQTVHKYVEGEQSISRPTSFNSDSDNQYTPSQTIHEPVVGEQSKSAPTGN